MASRGTRSLATTALAVFAVLVVGLVVYTVRHLDHEAEQVTAGAPPLKVQPIQQHKRGHGPWLLFGDSYAEGTGADSPGGTGYVQKLSACIGQRIEPNAQGGTGYIEQGPRGQTPPRTVIPKRVPDMMREWLPPKVVIFAAGINDRPKVGVYHTVSTEDLRAAALKSWAEVKALRPKARIVVVGPWWPDPPVEPGVLTVRDTLRDAAQSKGYTFIDPTGWITTANEGRYVGPDHAHPSQAGHDYLAHRLAAELVRLKIARRSSCPAGA